MPEWALEYFERGYAQRWGLPPVTDRIRSEISGLWKCLQLNAGAGVVDLGCGHGRQALALSEHGANVVGVDAAVALLTRARELSSDAGLNIRWVRGDMRRLPFRSESFDAAMAIDAFGFFETEDENEAVLLEAARVMVSGGRLGLKVVNGSRILADFRDHDREEHDGTIVAVSRRLTREPARLIEHIEISGSRGSGSYERQQRLYSVDALRAVVERAGLSVVNVFGSASGSTFEPAHSPTMWVIGERKPCAA